MKNIIILIAMTIILAACSSGELSRAKAKKMIAQKYGFPLVEYRNYDELTLSGMSKKYLNNGMTTMETYYRNEFGKQKQKQRQVITEEGNTYVVKTITNQIWGGSTKQYATNLQKIDEITGIRTNDDNTRATVELSVVRYNSTPWGDEDKYINEGDVLKKSIKFEKYDDGWRITGPKKLGRCMSFADTSKDLKNLLK